MADFASVNSLFPYRSPTSLHTHTHIHSFLCIWHAYTYTVRPNTHISLWGLSCCHAIINELSIIYTQIIRRRFFGFLIFLFALPFFFLLFLCIFFLHFVLDHLKFRLVSLHLFTLSFFVFSGWIRVYSLESIRPTANECNEFSDDKQMTRQRINNTYAYSNL